MRCHFARAIVVEDESDLRDAIARMATGWCERISLAGSAAEAKGLLAKGPPPDLILIDVRLPDASALAVLDDAARLSPAPVVVAMSGKASPDEAFQLAQRGVRGYLPKPFGRAELEAAVEAACATAPDLAPWIAAQVGRVPMKKLQREVRSVMVREALARTEGSRSGAARLLHVTRQAVQQMLRGTPSPNDP